MSQPPRESAFMLLSEGLVRRVARLLAEERIPLLLLKGALWQRTLYAPSEPRPMVDVDAIVPAGCFERARARLLKAGFVALPNPQGPHEQELCAPDLPLPLDLHRSVFARGRYELDVEGLFRRAHEDGQLFGVPVWIPDVRDQLAHLIGHLATDHRPGEPVYREDFARLLERSRLAPETAAAHLAVHGLGRAARFALPELAGPTTQAWSARCLAALGPDPVGDAFAGAARAVVARRGRFSFWSSLAGHTLNTDLAHAARATGWAALARLRARWA